MRPPRERANHRSSHERRGMVPSRSFAGSGLSAVRFAIAASAALLVASAVSANAAEKTLIDQGEVLVRENCSRCHAIGKEGDSPHKEAPPFRTLAKNYPIEGLAESLAEGIVSGHPTCRSSCSARTTSRRSSNICRAFRRSRVSASRPWRQARSRAPVSPRSQALQGRRAAAREPPNRTERPGHGLSDDR